ncbi:MAG: DUF4214 domain-containing protein [Clostridia bacterium]|nr:DUF4214 domain-containing protein [Clostridia bacterium]
MKKLVSRIASVALTASLVLSSMCLSVKADTNSGVVDFVTRCYDIALGREPDAASLEAWTDKLEKGEECGVTVAYGFVYSNEFQGAGYDNATYVEKMYNMLLGRDSDEVGKASWVKRLDEGGDKSEIFLGFANSQEFYNLCESYGVFAGYYNMDLDMHSNALINGFVDRFYSICLGRHGDIAGQKGWVTSLASGALTGVDLANGFVFSNEFLNAKVSNEDYVDVLYHTFMGRDADSLAEVWSHYLNRGSMCREEVFDNFSSSAEFGAICSNYGIIAGDMKLYGGRFTDSALYNFTPIYSNKLITKMFEIMAAEDKGNLKEIPLGNSEGTGAILFSTDFDLNFDHVELVGNVMSDDITYEAGTSSYTVRIYCKKASDETLFYGYSSTMFYGFDYTNKAVQQFDGENYYYDLTYTMPFNLFDYTQDVVVNGGETNSFTVCVSDENESSLYMMIGFKIAK